MLLMLQLRKEVCGEMMAGVKGRHREGRGRGGVRKRFRMGDWLKGCVRCCRRELDEVYIYTCIYVYIFVCVYIHTWIYIYINKYMQMYVLIYMYTYIFVYIHMYIIYICT